MTRLLLPILMSFIAATANAAIQPDQLDLRSKGQPLSALLESIAEQCDAGLAVPQIVQDRLARLVTLTARKATWAEASRWLADEFRMTMRLVGNHLEIGDADREFRARLVSATYDIRTLTQAMNTFIGPDLEILEPRSGVLYLTPPIEPKSILAVNEFIKLVQLQVEPETWSIDGVTIKELNGSLLVTQVPEIQTRIAAYIEALERAAARQVVVRCHRLPAAAPLPTTLDSETWNELAKKLGAPAGMVLQLDEQQNSHFSGTQRLVIMDADINQGVFDPIVAQLSDGLVVDVQTHVTHAGVVTTARLSHTHKQAITPAPILSTQGKVLTPIELVGSDLDQNRDTRVIPDGGAGIYHLDGQTFALSVEVLDFTSKP